MFKYVLIDFYSFKIIQNLIDYYIVSRTHIVDDYMISHNLQDFCPILLKMKGSFNFTDIASSTTALLVFSKKEDVNLAEYLSKSLQTNLIKKDSSVSKMHLRFYDSRVLNVLMTSLSIDKISNLFYGFQRIEYFDYVNLVINKVDLIKREIYQQIEIVEEDFNKITDNTPKIGLANLSMKYLKTQNLGFFQNFKLIKDIYFKLIKSGFDNTYQGEYILDNLILKKNYDNIDFLFDYSQLSDYRYLLFKDYIENASISF